MLSIRSCIVDERQVQLLNIIQTIDQWLDWPIHNIESQPVKEL